jgi:cell division protein FtsL|nr:MAG TPA: shock protein B [Caudoviricetes sp.]
MTWEIFLGIVALTGFVITIGKIVSANTKALTKLEDSILELNRTITEEKKDISDLDETVQNHETRIQLLEHK